MNPVPPTRRPTGAAPVGHVASHSRRSVAATGGLLAALALGVAAVEVGGGGSRAHAQSTPQPADFPPLSLTYSDARGPGQATITPHGPDEATDGIVIALTIAQATRTLSGSGFVRQVGPRGYVMAAAVTGVTGASGGAGEGYFLAGTLARGEDGVRWRGRGRLSSVASPSLTHEWHMADWPAIEPPARPPLLTMVLLDPTEASGVTGAITLIALPEGETRFELQLAGLAPATDYGIRLHAGNAARPSASFTQLATVTADATGRANASGLVRFRGSEPVPLLDIAGGGHFIAVVGSGGTVAASAIPALQPLG